MPKFLEEKLKKKYGKNSSVPYKIMNSIGAMHGSKETKKGAQMEEKHEKKIKGLGSHNNKMHEVKKKKKSFTEAMND
jgi:hypothetical protein